MDEKQITVIRSTYTAAGGVERVTVSLIEGLLKKGVRVTLLSMPNQKWPLAGPHLDIVPVGIGRGHRLLQVWSFNRGVRRYLSRYRTACVLSLDKVVDFTHLHAGGGTHKTFLEIRRRYDRGVAGFFRRISLFHRYILYLEKKGFESPYLQKVRCNSSLVLDDIRRDYNVALEKLIVVPSGIRWKEMGPVFDNRHAVGAGLCRRHQLRSEWKMLLFLGSGFSRKGLDVAIRGLGYMPSDYHLVIVGKGRSGYYQKLASGMGLGNRVHFLGPQPSGWRFAALARAMVLPSQYDPFGGAAAEGHAMGIPALVSDKTGYVDNVIHGQNGVILKTPMTDAAVRQAFAELHALIENPTWTAGQFREHARQVDDDIVLEKLLEDFLPVPKTNQQYVYTLR